MYRLPLALALAAWMRRVRGEDETGAPIPIRHPLAAMLQERAAALLLRTSAPRRSHGPGTRERAGTRA